MMRKLAVVSLGENDVAAAGFGRGGIAHSLITSVEVLDRWAGLRIHLLLLNLNAFALVATRQADLVILAVGRRRRVERSVGRGGPTSSSGGSILVHALIVVICRVVFVGLVPDEILLVELA